MITLKCPTCGKKHNVEDMDTITSSLGLIHAAQKSNWLCVPHTITRQGITTHSIVIFCSEECLKAQQTKSGKLKRYFTPINRKLNDNRNPTAELATPNESTVDTTVLQMLRDTVKHLPGFVNVGVARRVNGERVLYAEFDTLENSQRADVPEEFGGYAVRTTHPY